MTARPRLILSAHVPSSLLPFRRPRAVLKLAVLLRASVSSHRPLCPHTGPCVPAQTPVSSCPCTGACVLVSSHRCLCPRTGVPDLVSSHRPPCPHTGPRVLAQVLCLLGITSKNHFSFLLHVLDPTILGSSSPPLLKSFSGVISVSTVMAAGSLDLPGPDCTLCSPRFSLALLELAASGNYSTPQTFCRSLLFSRWILLSLLVSHQWCSLSDRILWPCRNPGSANAHTCSWSLSRLQCSLRSAQLRTMHFPINHLANSSALLLHCHIHLKTITNMKQWPNTFLLSLCSWAEPNTQPCSLMPHGCKVTSMNEDLRASQPIYMLLVSLPAVLYSLFHNGAWAFPTIRCWNLFARWFPVTWPTPPSPPGPTAMCTSVCWLFQRCRVFHSDV